MIFNLASVTIVDRPILPHKALLPWTVTAQARVTHDLPTDRLFMLPEVDGDLELVKSCF